MYEVDFDYQLPSQKCEELNAKFDKFISLPNGYLLQQEVSELRERKESLLVNTK